MAQEKMQIEGERALSRCFSKKKALNLSRAKFKAQSL